MCDKLYDIQKELYGGAIENLNPDMDIKEQAIMLPFEKGTWEIPRERIKLGMYIKISNDSFLNLRYSKYFSSVYLFRDPLGIRCVWVGTKS